MPGVRRQGELKHMMNCPNCQTLMTKGQAVVKSTLLGWLLAGFSYMSLYFRLHPKDELKEILGPNDPTEGYLCPQCEALLIRRGRRFANREW